MGKMRPSLGRHIDPSGLSGVLKTDGTTVTAEEQLALVRGGTGATDPAEARINLGAASAADLAALELAVASKQNALPTSPTNRFLKYSGGAFSLAQVNLASAEVTGALPIANGGTGATSAAQARTALGAAATSHTHTIPEVVGLADALMQGDFLVRSRTSNLVGVTSSAVAWTYYSAIASDTSAFSVVSAEKARLILIGKYRVTASLCVVNATGTAMNIDTVLYTTPVGSSSNTDVDGSRVRQTVHGNSTSILQTSGWIEIAPGQAREVGVWVERATGSGSFSVLNGTGVAARSYMAFERIG